MYKVIWQDWCGNEHEKIYKYIGCAMRKIFAVRGWYKNGNLIRIRDNTKIL